MGLFHNSNVDSRLEVIGSPEMLDSYRLSNVDLHFKSCAIMWSRASDPSRSTARGISYEFTYQ